MTIIELAAEFHKAHNPELAKVEGGHVTIAYADGEICGTKCGSLLGQRNLHQMERPFFDKFDWLNFNTFGPDEKVVVAKSLFPTVYPNHPGAYTDDPEKLRKMVAETMIQWIRNQIRS